MKSQIFLPNEFQFKAQKKVEEAILEGEIALLVVMPTGTGKTYLAAQWFRLRLEKNPKARLLYVCHNQDILSQANDKEFANCLSEFDIPRGYYNGSEKNIGQITFATVQTLRENLDKLPSDYFDYIIVDEAHHYRAKSFEKTIKHFSPKVLLGLTATPNRMDGKPLSDVFGRTVYSASISDGIKNGLLSKIKYYYVDNDIDFSEIERGHNGNYSEKDLNKKLCVKEYDDAIIKEYKETVKRDHNRKKTICFCATVEHAYRMEKLFNGNGIKAVALTGKYYSKTGKEATVLSSKRKQIISMFKDGDYDIIFVRDLFNEGMDIPDADCIMMMRPTESSRIFTQQIGRGLRVWKGKDYLLTLDFTGNCYRCDINYDVLNDMLELDIEKDAKSKIRDNSNIREIVIENLGCEVRLSKRKIDVIKDSEKEEETITKEQLIENYFNVKNKLCRQPTCEDFVQKNNVSLYPLSAYMALFESWNDFLSSINETFLRRDFVATEKALIDNYLEVKKNLGRQPLSADMQLKISLFGSATYLKYFGSWHNFLDKVGDVPSSSLSFLIPEEDLIENYLNVKKELGRIPLNREMNIYGKFSGSTYVNRFSSWNEFLLKMGEKVEHRKIITDEDLIKNYLDLKSKYPDLTSEMVTRKNGSLFGSSTYKQHFGSWTRFLVKMGDKEKCRKTTTEKDLIENYLKVKKELNRIPECMEIAKYGKFSGVTYVKRFGSWNNFLLRMGDIVEDRKIISEITDKNLIKNYWDLKNKYPYLTYDMVTKENGSRFDKEVYINRFGSWNKFLGTLGEKLQYRKRTTDDELIRNYLNMKDKYPDLTSDMLTKKNGSEFSEKTYRRHFGSWKKFFEVMSKRQSNMEETFKNNIVIIPDYAPKNPIPSSSFEKCGRKSLINARALSGYRYGGSEDKDNIRHKIIDKIQDNDTVLMLESPDLEAIKEIEKQGKNPKKIIIPNNLEFDGVATALRKYDTNLNIELINTSALQYIVDHPEEHFNFLWLDYCGGFSYYTRDLEAVFQREIKDMKLILTYNIFDPKKQDDSYYFTNVIGYVLKKLRGKNEILLMEDVSQRYKKTMFSVGFDIKELAQF